jgi:hypothetical protein
VYDVADTTKISNYTSDSGAWVAGNNWINGTVPSTTALGNYYIKAVDQIGSSVAFTDTYITVNPISYNATLNISPPSGPGGVPIAFTGSNYPVGQNVTISYLDPAFGTWNYLTSIIANASGKISANSVAPDLLKSLGIADYPETYASISYRSEIQYHQVLSYANYNEYERGLKNVGTSTANGLYGNGTNLVSNVRAMVGDSISISGKWFHPGVIYVRWDSTSIVGTVTSNEWLNAVVIGSSAASSTNGSFNTSVTIPNAAAGEHYIAVEDSQTRVIVKIFISSATLQLSPPSGPGGATVQFTGTGYTPSTSVTLSYLDPTFNTWNPWTTTTSDSTGRITLPAQIPDLQKSSSAGDMGTSISMVSFRTEVNGAPCGYVDYSQYWRGLTQVGGQVATGLFGNGTNLVSSVNVRVGNSLVIAGRWFHPGVVYVRFDGVNVVGTVTSDEWRNAQVIGTTTASTTGSFSTTVTIPTASGGEHYLSIEDSQTHVITKVNVSAPIIPTPTPIPAQTANPTPTPVPTPNPTLPTPLIDFTCKSTSTGSISKVEINGNLLLGGNPLADSPILISYSVTNGNTWVSLTLVRTQTDGSFTAVWQPEVTGNYLVKATSDATTTMNGATKTINLALTPENPDNPSKNVFTLTSNSTVTQFAFDPDSKQLSFVVSGPTHTTGYVNIYIPKSVLSDASQLKAYLDGNEISFNSESQTDSWLISFNYSHSQHTITMAIGSDLQVTDAGSLSNWLFYAVPIALVAVIAAAVVIFKNRAKK